MSEQDSGPSIFTRIYRKMKVIIIILIVLFTVAPIILAAIPGTESNQTFSIYSDSYDGYSIIRSDIETQTFGTGPKYEALNIISNLNALNRFNGSGALIIAGPAANFEFTETISVVLYLLRGGSVIIIDDFGTGNQILDPIFSAFENIDKFSEQADNLGFSVPGVDEIFNSSSSESTSGGTGGTGDLTGGLTGGSSSSGASSLVDSNLLTNLIGKVILRFAFNHTGVLMDVDSNNQSPVRPIITDIDDTQLSGYTFTQNIKKIQMEFGTVISVKIRTKQDVLLENGTTIQKDVDRWQPLQKLSTALLTGGTEGVEISLPFFPLYSSKLSWIETNMKEAKDGTAQPDVGEWGNAQFATALSLPLFPGMGKLVFLSDPSIFINRWTADTANNDNLLLFRNMIEMATDTQEPTFDQSTGEVKPIPIIFDFGHTYQSLTSPALYSSALMKLIAEMSMFPLYAPFVPLAAYGYGKRLMPESRRLRPILLTKRRGEKGRSDFEAKLDDIKESGGYGEPILHLSRRLVRLVQSDVRFTGLSAKNTSDTARFFIDNFQVSYSRRELQNLLKTIFKIAENPTRRMTLISAKRYLKVLKNLLDYLG